MRICTDRSYTIAEPAREIIAGMVSPANGQSGANSGEGVFWQGIGAEEFGGGGVDAAGQACLAEAILNRLGSG